MTGGIEFIGNVSGSTELFNNGDAAEFDNVYACVEDVLGVPILAQIIKSTPEAAIRAIRTMLWEINPYVLIQIVDELESD